MKRIALAIIYVAILLWVPHLVFSDCVDVRRFTVWYPQGEHILVFYRVATPIARVNIPNCSIKPSSTVRLITNYLCDSDKIIINGEPCNIMTVTSASAP